MIFRSVVITGASSGIGAALAVELSNSGTRLLLIGRDAERLSKVAADANARGADVETSIADIRDTAAMASVLTDYDSRFPIDLLIANAGVSAGLEPGHQPEAPGVSRRLMETNYGGMLNTVEPLLPNFIRRRSGRIALVSSLAALRPQPDLLSYSATKMAVRGYGIALRGWLKEFGIGVTVIYPGFVTSPMSLRHEGYKPGEISAEKAARLIVARLRKGRAIIAFPFLLTLGTMINMLLPAWFSDFTNRGFRADVKPDGKK